MGLHRLFGFCFALLSFSSVVVAQTVTTVSTEVAAGTTTYRVLPNTVATPSGVALSTARDITPVQPQITRHAGGLAQSFRGQLIVAEKVSTPLIGRFNVSSAGVKQAAKVALRNPVVVGGLLVGNAIGLQALLDTADWTVEGDTIVRPDGSTGDPSDPSSWGSAPEGVTYRYGSTNYASINEAGQAAVDALPPSVCQGTVGSCSLVGFNQTGQSGICLQNLTDNCSILPIYTNGYGNTTSSLIGFVHVVNPTGDISCATGTYSPEFYGCLSDGDFVPVTESELDDLIDSSYQPEPEDWPVIFPNMWPDTVTVDPIPSVQLDPEITSVTDNQTGTTTVTETTTDYDFSVSNNNSVQPEVNLNESTTTNTYENGSLTGSSTTTSTRPARPSGAIPLPPETGTGSGGGGFEFPSFCSWATVICDWLDWTREPLDEDEPDLSAILTDEDFEQSYSFSFGTSSCPEPISINVAFLNKNIDLSYEPVCDLAGYAKPFVLISAYIFAIYIGLGVVRNG